eukprot:scaffold105821_cov33-Tisochrysis_lutea.AAC.2
MAYCSRAPEALSNAANATCPRPLYRIVRARHAPPPPKEGVPLLGVCHCTFLPTSSIHPSSFGSTFAVLSSLLSRLFVAAHPRVGSKRRGIVSRQNLLREIKARDEWRPRGCASTAPAAPLDQKARPDAPKKSPHNELLLTTHNHNSHTSQRPKPTLTYNREKTRKSR